MIFNRIKLIVSRSNILKKDGLNSTNFIGKSKLYDSSIRKENTIPVLNLYNTFYTSIQLNERSRSKVSYSSLLKHKRPDGLTGNERRRMLVKQEKSKRFTAKPVSKKTRGFIPTRFKLESLPSDIKKGLKPNLNLTYETISAKKKFKERERNRRDKPKVKEIGNSNQVKVTKFDMAETETIESLEKRIEELNFEDLGLYPQLLESIQKLFPNIEPTKLKPTEIQALAIPELLKNNKSHILLAAETGSGKTLAYLLPIISKLKSEEGNDILVNNMEMDSKDVLNSQELRLLSTTDLRKLNRPRAIVLVPSCALAEQVYAVSKKISHLAKFRTVLLTRSTVRKDFLRRLNTPFDILVTTPASLKRYLLTGNLSLSEVTQMAIDEADTMFEKGFAGDVKDIIDGVKKTNEKLKRSYQIQIVSATLPKLVLQTLDKLFPNILKITTPSLHKALPNCKQHFVDLKDYQGNRQLALLDILRQFDQRTSSTAQQKSRDRIIIFCNTRKSVSIAQTFLMDRKIPNISLYGKEPFPNTPPATEKEIQQFLYPSSPTVSSSYAFSNSNRETETETETDTTIDKNPKILLCTDIASRGLDTTSVNHVILYDFPTSVVDFLHRCGRTARAGKSGIVTALVGKKDRSLSERIKRSIRTKTVLS